MKNTKNAKATCFYLKTPKKKIVQMSQINKILEIQFLFQWLKFFTFVVIKVFIIKCYTMEKTKNLIGTTKSDFFKSL